MIIKLAVRNIVGNGWRSLINMIIFSIVMIGMIWMQSMYYSWIKLAETEAKDWEIGTGQYQETRYNRFDSFSWDKSFSEIPDSFNELIKKNLSVPILISPSVIYPNGRMSSAIIKGIPFNQQVLKLPTVILKAKEGIEIPTMIGTMMAKNCRLKKGDVFTARLKDQYGSYNTVDLRVATIMNTPVPTTDAGQIWIDLKVLQDLKQAPNIASILVMREKTKITLSTDHWRFVTPDSLLADLYKIEETERGQQMIIFALLLFLAMIAIFDTQVLSLFKRRKEIGMLSALGMTKGEIITLFTVEGVLYMVFSIFFTIILGFPLFYYYAVVGYKMPKSFDGMGIAGMSDAIHFSYPPHIILGTFLLVFVLTVFVSWIPALRILKLKPTEALKGK